MTPHKLMRLSAVLALLIGGTLSPPAGATTLRVAAGGLPPSLGNPFTAQALPATELWISIFDGLTRLDWRGGPQPGLATSWSNPTPTTWRFVIRDNVSFHNGRTLTASTVADVFDILLGESGQRYLVTRELENIAGTVALDSSTIEVTLREPDAILPNRLSTMMIVDPQVWVEDGVDAFTISPVGTGPYRLAKWGPGNTSATLTAFTGSWRTISTFDTIEYLAVQDKTSRLQALFGDSADIVTGLSQEDVSSLEANGYAAHVTPTTQIKSIALPNVRDGDHPLKDERVRRALNLAVDKDAIANVILGGRVNVASQGAVEGIAGFNPDLEPYPYDPARARALLAEAGYAGGFKLDIEFTAALTPLDVVVFQKVAQDLNSVGVDTSVRMIPFADYIRKYSNNDWGNVDAFGLLWNVASFQDAIRPFEYFSCLRVNPFFCDEGVAADVSAVRTMPDPLQRAAKMRDIMARLHALAPAIWLTNSAYVTGARQEIQNFDMIPTGIVFEGLTLADERRDPRSQ